MTFNPKVYVVGRGYRKESTPNQEKLAAKLEAKKARNKLNSEMRAQNDKNNVERAKRMLVAKHFLDKSFAWQKIPSTKAGDFYSSPSWAKVRYAALLKYNGRCVCCGATAADGVRMHVDHIKPRSKFPELSLDLENLQVLCEMCNLAKSNVDDTDWRKSGTYIEGSLDEYSDAKISAFLSSL